MSNLVRIASNDRLYPSRIERSASRSIERIRASQQIATATQVAKVEVIADTTEAALLACSHISIIESLLADHVSHAEGRLHQIAKAGTIGLTEVVIKAAQEVR